MYLKSEQKQKGHHKTEKSHSFRQSEAQNGVGKQLLLERGVAGITNDEGTKYWSNTSSRSGNTDGGGACTDEFGSRVDILPHSSGGKCTASLKCVKKSWKYAVTSKLSKDFGDLTSFSDVCKSTKNYRQSQNGLCGLAGDHSDLTDIFKSLPVGPRGWQ